MEASMTRVFSGSPVLAGFRESLGASQKKKKKKEFDFVVWHLCNGYSVHSFPGFCWFTDYSDSILIKLYLIWVCLVVCLVWSVERSCFGKWVDTCAEKALADVLTWCNDKRWFQQRVQEWVRDLSTWLRECHERDGLNTAGDACSGNSPSGLLTFHY